MKCTLDSKLQIGCICSIGIPSRNRDIVENSHHNNTSSASPPMLEQTGLKWCTVKAGGDSTQAGLIASSRRMETFNQQGSGDK